MFSPHVRFAKTTAPDRILQRVVTRFRGLPMRICSLKCDQSENALQVLSRDIRSAHQRAHAPTPAGAGGAARVHACERAEALQAGARFHEREGHSRERAGAEGCSGAAAGCIRACGALLPAGCAEEAVHAVMECTTGSRGQQAHADEHAGMQERSRGVEPGCGGVFRVTLLGIEVSYNMLPAGLVHVCGACYRQPVQKEELDVCI